MAYDALKSTSAVEGGPNSSRITGWYPSRAHWVTSKTNYEPAVLAEFTISHLKRDQLRMSLGTSYTSETTPTSTWYPNDVLYYAGGPYGFNGTTVNTQATFYLDFSDISTSGGLKRYYLGVYDRTQGDPAVLTSFKLIDLYNGGVEIVGAGMPRSADLEQIYAYVDYDFNDGNMPPTAIASANPVSGVAPLVVNFDGTQSSDTNGNLVDYTWDFGDQSQAKGETVQHTYQSSGNYDAVLTVTDNSGATSQDHVAIIVNPDPTKVILVNNIEMSLFSNPAGKAGVANITIVDLDGSPVDQATVNGFWSGLVNQTVSGITGADGSIVFTSKKSKKDGTFTFTVTSVSLAGYQYNPSLNQETTDSVDTFEPVNENPIAQINASQTSGEAPLIVSFDGSSSYDPDGAIATYQWDFGDGETATGAIAEHTFNANGNFSVILTVSDNLGAKDTDNVTINIIDPNLIVYVYDIEMQRVSVPGGEAAQAMITVRDGSGWLVPGALVSVAWSGGIKGTSVGTTDTNGQVLLESKKTRSSEDIVVSITEVSKAGYLYDPNINIESNDSI